MTKAEALRTLVATLDGEGLTVDEIAAAVGITVARVDRILDDQDVPHPIPRMALIEQPARSEKTAGPRLIAGGPAVRDICGTLSGYWKHRKMREQPCRGCLNSYNDHKAGKPPGPNGRPEKPISHGTSAGRQQERRRGLPPCDPCRLAFNADRARAKREQYARKKESS